jgi:hypothetical protein
MSKHSQGTDNFNKKLQINVNKILMPILTQELFVIFQVRKKGSQAGKILRDKANELEEALKDTKAKYSVEMIRD